MGHVSDEPRRKLKSEQGGEGWGEGWEAEEEQEGSRSKCQLLTPP